MIIAHFLFYNKGQGRQQIFTTKGIKHCNVVCYDGRTHTLIETDEYGLSCRTINIYNTPELHEILKKLKYIRGVITTQIKYKKKIPWFPVWIRSCNEVCRYSTGIDIGLTINPTHLANKLIKYNNRTNYEILDQWWGLCK